MGTKGRICHPGALVHVLGVRCASAQHMITTIRSASLEWSKFAVWLKKSSRSRLRLESRSHCRGLRGAITDCGSAKWPRAILCPGNNAQPLFAAYWCRLLRCPPFAQGLFIRLIPSHDSASRGGTNWLSTPAPDNRFMSHRHPAHPPLFSIISQLPGLFNLGVKILFWAGLLFLPINPGLIHHHRGLRTAGGSLYAAGQSVGPDQQTE